MDSHQLDIVRLAWCRTLGLGDRALDSKNERVEQHSEGTAVTVLQLSGTTLVSGPLWLLDAARARTDDALTTGSGLTDLLAARPENYSVSAVTLAYGAEIGNSIDVHDPLISHDLAHVLALEEQCSAGDVAEADVTRKRNWFTLLGDDRPADSAGSLSSAGYLEQQMILADMSVLTAPDERRRGYAQVVAQLATNDAIDEGLVPQWRARPENTTARRLAARLGFSEVGLHVSATATG